MKLYIIHSSTSDVHSVLDFTMLSFFFFFSDCSFTTKSGEEKRKSRMVVGREKTKQKNFFPPRSTTMGKIEKGRKKDLKNVNSFEL